MKDKNIFHSQFADIYFPTMYQSFWYENNRPELRAFQSHFLQIAILGNLTQGQNVLRWTSFSGNTQKILCEGIIILIPDVYKFYNDTTIYTQRWNPHTNCVQKQTKKNLTTLRKSTNSRIIFVDSVTILYEPKYLSGFVN